MNFPDMLSRGLGRAVLFLQNNDPKPCREAILHACRHFVGYDAQTEPSRAQYLFDVIQATGEPEYYASCIREMLTADEEAEDAWQVFDVASRLAKQGDQDLREAMYATYARNAAMHETTGADALIELDGLEGYLFVARHLIEFPLPEDDHWLDGLLLHDLEEKLGKEEARVGLDRACVTDPALATYIARLRREDEQDAAERKKYPRRPHLDYDEIRRIIESGKGVSRPPMHRWGENADDESITRLADDFIHEGDQEKSARYLHVFYRRRFPLNPECLLSLARGTDEQVAPLARRALSNVTDPRVRALALELMSSSRRPWEGVQMLVSNYKDGDYTRIEAVLAGDYSADERHWLGYSVRDVWKAHPLTEAAPVLTMLYDLQPCSLCRHRAVESLLSLGPLPQWMMEECWWDADPETRKLVMG